MALSAAGVIEVRTTGSDSNGGGFKTGATGTDFSQQNAAQFALTGLTTTGASAIIATTSAAATMVGNYINITGGTNFTVGIYEIISAVAGVSITVDRNAATAAGAAGVGNIGGALATIGKALALMTITGMISWVKASATYTLTTSLTTPSGVSGLAGFARVVGYNASRGDGGQASITSASSITAVTDNNGGFRWENLNIVGASTITNGFALSNINSAVFNCTIKSVNSTGIIVTGQNCSIVQNEIASCGSEGINHNATTGEISSNNIHNNSSHGIECIGIGVNVHHNLVTNNGSKGILINAAYGANKSSFTFNTLYGNASDGFSNTGTYGMSEIANNLFVNNGGFGLITTAMNPLRDEVLIHHNGYYNNTSGNRSGNNVATGDVTLTGVPFTNAAGNDYSLNNTASQGAACRGAGYPGIFPGGLTTGYYDIGAVQHRDSPAAVIPVINQIINQYIQER